MPGWRRELAEAYRDPGALLAALGLEPATVGLSPAAAASFGCRVTRAYAARMRHGDPADPLLRQVLPTAAETRTHGGFGDDPVGEFGRADGSLLRKYHGRALLVTTGACAIHCRYCFRRAYPYAGSVGTAALQRALELIAADGSLHEVILSGGDPLVLDDATLAGLLEQIAGITHVRRVRVHTRLPVVLPARMTDALLAAFGGARCPVTVVIHANHPREIDAATAAALRRSRAAGVTVLNQAVLLAGVNDDAAVLAELSETLFDHGVLPYYVHLLDRVSGTAHFEVSEQRAHALEGALRDRLPGYLVPRFVREIAGATAKLPLNAVPGAA